FNQTFPDNSGFAKRCKMEIDALSKDHELVILCRNSEQKEDLFYLSPYKKIPIKRFNTSVSVIGRPTFYIPEIYEIVRNIFLLWSLGRKLYTLISKYKNQNIELYVVSSPLTVPFIAYIIAKFKRAKCSFLEFHDLEPE